MGLHEVKFDFTLRDAIGVLTKKQYWTLPILTMIYVNIVLTSNSCEVIIVVSKAGFILLC